MSHDRYKIHKHERVLSELIEDFLLFCEHLLTYICEYFTLDLLILNQFIFFFSSIYLVLCDQPTFEGDDKELIPLNYISPNICFIQICYRNKHIRTNLRLIILLMLWQFISSFMPKWWGLIIIYCTRKIFFKKRFIFFLQYKFI